MRFRKVASASGSARVVPGTNSGSLKLLGYKRILNRCRAIAAAMLLACGSIATAEQIPLPAFHVLAENCAPSVSPDIMEKLVRAESGFNRFSIGVNGAAHRSYNPASREEATQIARELISQGHSIDLGLGQINSANLDWLDLTLESVFDSCANLKAAEQVLRDGYDRARRLGAGPETALHQALSAYNTGTFTRGFANGYVARVMGGDVETPVAEEQPQATAHSAPEKTVLTWDVFSEGAASSALVFN